MPQYAPLSQTDIANLALKEIGQQPIADIDQQQGTAAPACASVFWQSFRELAQEFAWTCLKKRALLTGLSFGEASSAPTTAMGWPGCRPSTPPPYWAANTLYVGGTLVTWGEAIYYALYTYTSGTNFIDDMTDGKWAQIYSTFISYPYGGGADNGLYEWAFGYALPADFILAVELNGVSCVDPNPADYELYTTQVTNPDNTITTTRALFTDQNYADLKYTALIEDTTVWDPLFVNALAVLIASKIATPILGDGGATALQMRVRYDRDVLPRAQMKNTSSQRPPRYDPTNESNFIRSRWRSTVG